MSEETRTQETSQEEPQGQAQFSIREEDEYSFESPEQSDGQTSQTSEGETVHETSEEGETQEPSKEVDVDEKGRTSDTNPYWQAKYDREKAEWEAKMKEYEQKLKAEPYTQEKPPEHPNEQKPDLKPPEPPQRPYNYDPTEALTDPESPSYKYRESWEKYLVDKIEYQDKMLGQVSQTIEQQKRRAEQQQKAAEEKAYYTQSLTKAGADERESENIYKFFSSPDSLAPENLVVMYRAVRNQYANPKRKTEMEARGKRHGEPLPPNATPSESELPEKPNFGHDMVEYSKQQF